MKRKTENRSVCHFNINGKCIKEERYITILERNYNDGSIKKRKELGHEDCEKVKKCAYFNSLFE